MRTIYEFLEIADMRVALARYLNPFAIIRLAATSHRLRNILYTASSKRWNIGRWDIDLHLKRFVKDPKFFREMLGKCGGIVSGSNALQFLDGTCYEDSSHLEVYFDSMKGLVDFGDFMTEAELYHYSPNLQQNQLPDWESQIRKLLVVSILATTTAHEGFDLDSFSELRRQILLRLTEMGYPDLQIDSWCLEEVCFSSPLFGRKMRFIWSLRGPFEMVVNYNSTLVMNFFTWNAAYSLFPWLTFNQRRGIMAESTLQRRVLPSSGDFETKYTEKYVGRGFRIDNLYLNHPHIWKSVESHRPERAVNDPFTWCLPFDVDGIDPPLVVDTIPLYATFWVSTYDSYTGSTVAR